MGRIEELSALYHQHISAPWQRSLAGSQRVLMLVYEKELERTLRARIGLLEQATRRAGHGWRLVDCTTWFAEWMAADDYRDSYFKDPGLLRMKLEKALKEEVTHRLAGELEAADEETVVALMGVGSLYGFLRVSDVIHKVEQTVRGRLLVLFPGTKNGNNYRLLDARDGWNYLAQGVTLHGGGAST